MGPRADELRAGAEQSGSLPLLAGRAAVSGETTIQVGRNRAGQLPVHSMAEALEQPEETGLDAAAPSLPPAWR